MPKGMSLHVGLNFVDPRHYQGWDGELMACEADANDMADIAGANKFAAKVLLTKRATRRAVAAGLAAAARALRSGDTFLLTYSGHGGQLPDLDGEEADGMDETWCLYDGEMVDDEIYTALGKFRAGVRVLVLADCCHSGTVLKLAHYAALGRGGDTGMRAGSADPQTPPRFRAMPPQVALRTYQANKKMYDAIQAKLDGRKAVAAVKASAILISGCQDNQLSADGTFNGLFTGTLKRVWNGGAFKKPYPRFHRAIVNLMPPDQTPNYFKVGAIDAAFEGSAPFAL